MKPQRLRRPLALVLFLAVLPAGEALAQSAAHLVALPRLVEAVQAARATASGPALLQALRADPASSAALLEASVRLHEGTLAPETAGALADAGLVDLLSGDVVSTRPRTPRFPPTWTGTISIEGGNAIFLTTPSGAKARLLEPNGLGVAQWAEEAAAFAGNTASVRGYPGGTAPVIFANGYTPGSTDDFVHGRVYRVGDDVVVRDANGVEVFITDPAFEQRLGLFASTGYMGTGVILPGAVTLVGERLTYAGNPPAFWMLTAPNRRPNGDPGGTDPFPVDDGYTALDTEVPVHNSSMASVSRDASVFQTPLNGRAFQRGRILLVGVDAPGLGPWGQNRIFETTEIRHIPAGMNVDRGAHTTVDIPWLPPTQDGFSRQ